MINRSKTKFYIKQWVEVLPFIAMALVLITMFVFYPLIKNIFMSVSDYSILPNAKNPFVGLNNYIEIFKDEKTLYALRNSFLMVLITVPIQMFLGLILAYYINSLNKFKNFFKTAYYIPVITSWLVVSYVFKYLFAAGEGGLINYVLLALGLIDTPISWLQNTWTALGVIWIVSIWKATGWCMIIYLAGLQGIDKAIYESAKIDGANRVKTLIYITTPMLKPVSFYLVVNSVIGSFNSFIQTYIITNGDPVNTTHVMMSLMYSEGFDHFKFGVASAIGVLQGVLILIMIIASNKIFKNKSE